MATDDETQAAPLPPTASYSGDAARTVTRDPANPPRDSQAEIGTQAQNPDQMALSAASSAAAVEAVPGYEIAGELGRGGMGVVYRARDTRLNREVALKMILRADASRTTVARFWAEAEVMAAVKHPNVVQVYELGEHDGRPFMAMEFVPGGSLTDRLKDGPLSPHAAATILAKVASGVAAAHEQGIVHRDLKPGNILLAVGSEDKNNAGRSSLPTAHDPLSTLSPKVTDFGIAKRQSHDLTQTQALMGTPAYMAPEQAAAKAKYVGPPADVWSLGVMLYECLTGGRPFAGDTVESVFSRILFAEPPALRTVSRSVPRDLETIVSKCLSKEPEHRYPTAAELAADLGRFVRGEPIAARRVGPVERFGRWVRRKPTAAAAWGFSTLAVALALVLFVIFGFWRDAEGARDVAESAKKDAEIARDEADRLRGIADARRITEERLRTAAETAEKEALNQKGVAEDAQKQESQQRRAADEARKTAEDAQAKERELRKEVEHKREVLASIEYGRTVQVAHQEWRDNNIVGALELLNQTDKNRRGWEWNYVYRLCNAAVFTLKGHSNLVTSASFSPDGLKILTTCEDQTARVWDAKTGEELLRIKGHDGAVEAASFSPDGLRIVTASWDKTARVWDSKTGKEVVVFKGHTEGVRSASFSSDGERVVTASADETAKVWNARTGAVQLTLKGHEDGVYSAAFSPDGSRVVTASEDGTARVWNAQTGAELFRLKGHGDHVFFARFNPEGTRIVTASRDKSARVWNAQTGAELFALKGHTDSVSSACFSADGKQLVTGSNDRTARVWDAESGAEVLVLRGHTKGISSAMFNPDKTRVVTASADLTAKVWDTKAAPDVVASRGRLSLLMPEQFVARGWRVTKVPDGRVQIRDLTGAERTLKGHTGNVEAVAFSPDGSQIVTGGWDRMVKLWDARTGKELHTFRGHTGPVTSVSFSADGSRIVSGSWDKTAKVWDAGAWFEVCSLKGHTDWVNAVALSENGSRVITGGKDRAAKVWDARTGAELLTLKGHKDSLHDAGFRSGRRAGVYVGRGRDANLGLEAARSRLLPATPGPTAATGREELKVDCLLWRATPAR